MSMSMYDTCSFEHGDDQQLILQCVSNLLESATADAASNRDFSDALIKWMLLFAGALVFFMQAGFAMLCAGSVRKKNVNNTMLKNLLDACGAAIAFYMVGYGFAFGASDQDKSTFVGNTNFFLNGDVDAATFFFQYAFSATSVTIVAGTLAERCKMIAYFVYSFVLTGFVYPVAVHAIWSSNGFLSTGNSDALVGMGVVDFAGSAVVHLTGGSSALYATWILGARRGRFYKPDGTPRSKPGLTKGHSTALQMLGTVILWFGWYGFNPGSALLLGVDDKASVAATAAVTTTLAAASGAISALFTNAFIVEKIEGEFTLDIVMAMNGCLSGLVAITASCAVVTEWAAVLIGIFAGWVYLVGSGLLIRLKIDDAVDAVPVHMFNGMWGILAAGLFANPKLLLAAYGTDSHPGFFYSPTGTNLLAAQLVAIIFILVWTLVTMLPFFIALDFFGLFRVNELEEVAGLDASYLQNGKVEAEESDTDEDMRLEAYNLRLQQKKEEKEKKKTMMNNVLNASWGEASFDKAINANNSEGNGSVVDET